MQGPDPHDVYPRKKSDRALAQRIKETYGDVEKGTQGYKVSSIHSKHSVPCMLVDHMQASSQEPTHPSDWIHC
jgi:hypothetical protein